MPIACSSTISSEFSYLKTHQIIGSPDGDLTDYQVKFIIHSGNGTDNGQDVYLDGNSRNWPNDVRFTDQDYAPYQYWIESYDTNKAAIWVKIDSIPASPETKTIYMLYGKAGEPSASDGTKTFLAFDDFSTDRIGTNWEESYSYNGAWAWIPIHSIENGGYHLAAPKNFDGAAFLQLKNTLMAPSVSVVTLNFTDFHGRLPPWAYFSFDDGGANDRYFSYSLGYWGGTLGGFNPHSPSDKLKIEWSDGTARDNVRIYRGDVLQTTRSVNFSTARKPSFGLRTASMETIDAYFTNFYAYKYTANPPSHGMWADGKQALTKTPPMPPGIPAQTSPNNYAFVKANTIEGSQDGTLIDYQVKFVVHRGAGPDGGQDVYLDGRSQSWPNDLRFTDNVETPLCYWVESYDENCAIVWVKINNIPSAPGKAIVKLYYGRQSDTGMSNGSAVFPFFDHFSCPSMDTSKWNQLCGKSSDTAIANSIAAISDLGDVWDQWLSRTAFNKPYAMEALIRVSQDNDAWIVGNCVSTGVPDMFIGTYWSRNQYSCGGTIVDRKTDLTAWTRISMLASNADTIFVENGTVKARISQPTRKDQYLELSAIHHKTLYVDWIFIRKYTQNEPAPGAWDTVKPLANTSSNIRNSPTGYSFVKSHIIQGSPYNALTDYQMNFIVHKGNGMDNGRDIYLNGHSLSWPYDIRFTNSDNELLSYWIESSDANAATVWVKIDGIPKAPGYASINLYYGRPNDTGSGDGKTTFAYFEDWASYSAGSGINGQGGWKVRPGGTGDATIRTDGGVNVLSIGSPTADNSVISRAIPVNDGQAFVYKAKKLSGSDILRLGACDGAFTPAGEPVNGYDAAFGGFSQAYTVLRKYVNGSETDMARTPDSVGDTNYHIYEWTWSGNDFSALRDGIRLINGSDGTWTSMDTIALSVDRSNAYCSYILVRNFTINEPTHGIWGAEMAVLLPQTPQLLPEYSDIKSNIVRGSPDGALTDFQLKYIIHRNEGVDKGPDVYLNGRSKSWPNDIRFAGENNEILPYWLEAYDDRIASVWVKVDRIPVSGTTISLYYGKDNDQGASDGKATFEIFDGFDGSTLNTDVWNIWGNGSYKVSNGILRLKAEGQNTILVHCNESIELSRYAIETGGRVITPYTAPSSYQNKYRPGVVFKQGVLPGDKAMGFDTWSYDINGWTVFDYPTWNYRKTVPGANIYPGDANDGRFRLQVIVDGGAYTCLETLRGIRINGTTDLNGSHFGLLAEKCTNDYDWVFVRKTTERPPIPGVWTAGTQASCPASPGITSPGILESIGWSPITLILVILIIVILFLLLILVIFIFVFTR